MNLLISPHDDDQALFASFICQREKPLVVIVTDSWIQPIRGEIGCDAETRAKETLAACKILGCPVVRLGIRDDICNEWMLTQRLKQFQNFDKIYVPALQGGHYHHDLVNQVAKKVFGNVLEYTTYTKTEFHTTGKTEFKPTPEELEIKNQALECYQSQLNLGSTRPHFMAIRGKSEWIL